MQTALVSLWGLITLVLGTLGGFWANDKTLLPGIIVWWVTATLVLGAAYRIFSPRRAAK